jgi:hypothetical protein
MRIENIFTKLRIVALLYAICLLITACDDCPVKEGSPITQCETRIVTIERFNPKFTIVPGDKDGEFKTELAADYNIGMYLFPINKSSSGSFPNDSRFKNSQYIPIAMEPFQNGAYFAAILTGIPSNTDLIGDILVSNVSISPSNTFADLRFFGYLDRFPINFASENAQAFCDFVEANKKDILKQLKNLDESARFGKQLAESRLVNYTADSLVVLDSKGNLIGKEGAANVPTIPSEVKTKLLAESNSKNAIEIRVNTGNVYTYRSKDNKHFIFFVSEIRESTITPFRKRVTIMFYPVD